MAKPRDDAAVRTFADHEVIVPPNKLKKAVVPLPPGVAPDDPIARAEAALAELAGEFSTWMEDECERLDRARRAIKAAGITRANLDEFFLAAHDIRGDAHTFGFAHAGFVADSLCRLIEHSPDASRIPLSLFNQHVDAVRAIVREAGRANAAALATHLVTEIRRVTDAFLAHENRNRPEYLDGLFVPLVPSDDKG